MELKPWIVLYVLASLCVVVCVYLIYNITMTGDPSKEWMIWVFFGATLALVGGGFYMERDFKKRQFEESLVS